MRLNLLIFCVVLSQAIIGTISSKNISEPLDILVRNKRVINTEPGGDVPLRAGDFTYVVNIEFHNRTHCVGSVLSAFTVITAASCASEDISAYRIISGGISLYRGTIRNVIGKKIRLGNYVGARASDGIALFTVEPHFTTRYNSRLIGLHTGPILTGLPATVVGWGCYFNPGVRGTEYPRTLRSITVPIMRHRDCVDTYRGIYDITDEDVCIYDEHKHCGNTDSGAPLIIDGQLAGIYVRRAPFPFHRTAEIFVVLPHVRYSQWIHDNMIHTLI